MNRVPSVAFRMAVAAIFFCSARVGYTRKRRPLRHQHRHRNLQRRQPGKNPRKGLRKKRIRLQRSRRRRCRRG